MWRVSAPTTCPDALAHSSGLADSLLNILLITIPAEGCRFLLLN